MKVILVTMFLLSLCSTVFATSICNEGGGGIRTCHDSETGRNTVEF
jgi:hypothetical protein